MTVSTDAPATGARAPRRAHSPRRARNPFRLVRALLRRPLASYYLLVSTTALLLGLGLAMVYSATSVLNLATSGSTLTSLERQAISAGVGIVVFWLFQRLPVRTYRALARPGLLIAFILVGALDVLAVLTEIGVLDTMQFGPVRADELWLYVGPFQLQPSEIAKVALVIWAADVLVRRFWGPSGELTDRTVGTFRDLSRPLFTVSGLLLLLVGYNDLGTMVCLFVMLVGLLWAAGVRLRVFVGMGLVAALGVAALIFLTNNDYRLDRIYAFLNPGVDPLGDSYQVRQGFAAIANGGWFGVGLGEGRVKWGWLSNGHNDFIFAVIAEELGVVGCLVVLALFGVLTYTGLRIAGRCTNPYRRLVAAGVTALIAGQAIINIAGVVGLMPVTGLPLPLISDGGSALVVTLAMIGMLASFARAEPAAAQAIHARPPGRIGRLLWAPLPPLPVRRERAEDDRWRRDERPGRDGLRGRVPRR